MIPTFYAHPSKFFDAILHFAGVNRGLDEDVKGGNPDLANKRIQACKSVGADPHIVYANSIHAFTDTVYGQSKRLAGNLLSEFTILYGLILPHIFGECARPFYNNVTATLVHQLIEGETVNLNPEGKIQLLYAGEAAQMAIDAATEGKIGKIQAEGHPISVQSLFSKLSIFMIAMWLILILNSLRRLIWPCLTVIGRHYIQNTGPDI